jgi:hypothetical protein
MSLARGHSDANLATTRADERLETSAPWFPGQPCYSRALIETLEKSPIQSANLSL